MSALKYQILDIIYNYRVNSDLIVSKLKNKCGIAAVNSNNNNNVSSGGKSSHLLSKSQIKRRTLDPSHQSQKIKLHLFFNDLNGYLYNLTNYWNHLIPNACKMTSMMSNYDSCWNGIQFVR